MPIKKLIEIIILLLLICLATSASIPEDQTTTENMLTLVYIEKPIDPTECHEICGCDQTYIYNETINECVLNKEFVLMTILKQAEEGRSGYKYEADHDIANDDGMAKNIRIEAEKIFKGIIISVIIFIACASLCVVSACVYCCHINYSDRQLKNDVKVMAKKLKRNYPTKTTQKTKLEPMQESCNVVVENAGVYVV